MRTFECTTYVAVTRTHTYTVQPESPALRALSWPPIRASHSTAADRSGLRRSSKLLNRNASAKPVTQQTAVIGNKARDNALQTNGPVVDQVNNCSMVACQSCDVATALASIAPAGRLPISAPV